MNELHRPRHVLRSVGAVLAGLLAVVVPSTVTDLVLHRTGAFPPEGQPRADALFLLATAYRVAYAVLGGYVAARLAPDRPMTHALALGAVGVVASIAGALATWDAGPEFGPRWYPVLLVVTALPCAWAGGRLVGTRTRARAVA